MTPIWVMIAAVMIFAVAPGDTFAEKMRMSAISTILCMGIWALLDKIL